MKIQWLAENFYEKKYIDKILNELSKKDLDFEKYDFLIGSLEQLSCQSHNCKKTIALILSDEWRRPISFNNDIFLGFRHYNRNQENIFEIPLGYTKNFQDIEMKSIKDRNIYIGFSGQVPTNHRRNLLNFITNNFADLVKLNISNGFAKGLSGKDYSNFLMNTKIAFCPTGNINSETFRFFEAAKSGCIVLSVNQPQNYIYEECPMLNINDKEIVAKVYDIILDENIQQEYQNKTLDWWNRICSEKSIANFIFEKIKEKEI